MLHRRHSHRHLHPPGEQARHAFSGPIAPTLTCHVLSRADWGRLQVGVATADHAPVGEHRKVGHEAGPQ
eukprot:3180406-Rhodomonas_salina.1